eukprot:3443575-Amphidinium_carterae.1
MHMWRDMKAMHMWEGRFGLTFGEGAWCITWLPPTASRQRNCLQQWPVKLKCRNSSAQEKHRRPHLRIQRHL